MRQKNQQHLDDLQKPYNSDTGAKTETEVGRRTNQTTRTAAAYKPLEIKQGTLQSVLCTDSVTSARASAEFSSAYQLLNLSMWRFNTLWC